ncbi:fungal-specific transcription factor domain-containing protein [Massariosphaeria phaeospora]|uniref:Fungal-specific transcription factor domain-containing protein n=1 Tax=Massariosphaeria phaeospora TaxID=100035 RepID=A0A7C8I8P7_9PLEO|nr:fungal-specific transcription factor domain-containing protein [Massariosphaeria phaeospora]
MNPLPTSRQKPPFSCPTASFDYTRSPTSNSDRATETNRDLISLLEGLREHVSDTDKRKIEEMLSRVLDDVADATAAVDKSPEKVKSPELELEEGEANVSAEVGSNEELAMMDENLLETEQSRATGFMGKNSEVQWLRHVHYAADQKNASSPRERSEGPYGPPGKSTEAATARVDAMKRRQDKTGPLMHTSSCSFYMDDEDVRMDFMVEALDLPPFETAERLLKCYMGAVHNSFPLLAKKTFVNQFYHYYASVGRRQPYKLPQKWQAILNMVFAIGAVYSHLIEADWQADDRDHLLYHSRAWSLSLKDPWWFSHPDLAQMQTMGLLALYYLSIGHVNRSWIVIGMSLRGGCALGLHMRNEDRNASVEKKEILGRIWWGLYSLERILSAITGRPSVGMESDCSVPLPLPLSTDEINGAIIASRFGPQSAVYFAQEHIRSEPNAASSSSIRMLTDTEKSSNEPTNSGSYLKHAVTMGMINQRTLVALYAPSVASKSWQTVQKDIAELDEDLDAWSASLPLGLNFLQHEEEHQYTQERNALALHYYSTKILITRPCVCRLDRRIPDQTQKSRNFNQHIAETCIGAAKAISDLLPDDFQHQRVMLYKMGPWWILVHYIMQALAVLMLEVSYEAVNFPRDRHDMVPSIKKLVRWLRHTRSNNRMAGRAYDIVLQLLHKLTLKINIVGLAAFVASL